METEGLIVSFVNASSDPFAIQGLTWLLWLLVGIAAVWCDLAGKFRIGHLSIAALITVLASFFVTPASQALIFLFLACVLLASSGVHKEHHTRFRHHYIH